MLLTRADAFLGTKEEREGPDDSMQPTAAGMFVEELQSPTKQEIAEILDVDLSPRCRRSEDAAIVRDDKRMVETETLRETLDDGYRRDLALFKHLSPSLLARKGAWLMPPVSCQSLGGKVYSQIK